ncbi:MAG: fructose-6-phosphate aldolase [Acidobacteria bacterium]|nr:fructose-6-phosphate aldolase [Acidobacteriota bacterium]MBI3470584.1 fructose-6-phosphate aldolase [Candidatus Solibacter usitatus]
MKFFLDTANLDELKKGASWGVVDGVTTNPSLIAKEGRDIKDQVRLICDIVDGDISAEVVATEAGEMMREGRELARLHRNVVVKCPLTREGIKATKALSQEGIRVNVTLCFSPAQALIAAKAGAYIISPFVGRLDDVGHIGMDVIRDIATIYKNYGFKTQILAASLRHTLHVIEAARAGAHIGTMPFKVLDQLFNHPLTDKGLDQFLKDWNKVFQEAPVAR